MQRSVSSEQVEGKSSIATAAMAKDPAMNVDPAASQEHATYSLVFVARAAIVAVATLASALLGIAAQQFLGPSYVAEAAPRCFKWAIGSPRLSTGPYGTAQGECLGTRGEVGFGGARRASRVLCRKQCG